MTLRTAPTSHSEFLTQSRNGTSRRALLRTGAWAAPAITLAGAAPAYARSTTPLPSALAVTQASWSRSNILGNSAGWLGTPGDGQPGTPGGNVIGTPTGTIYSSGFYAAARGSNPSAGRLTAVWSVNVTSLKALTVAAEAHAPIVNLGGLRQELVLTMSKDQHTETVGAAHHSTTSPTAFSNGLPPGSTIVAPGGITTFTRTFTPTSTGLWSITATFSNGGEMLSMGAPQPFVLQTPSVAQAV